jgi:wyosine [tRNA(Phe)-imidazoG37] synthetase (radical SAM superfamily)
MQIRRQAFYKPDKILRDVEQQIEKAKKVNESIDYLTFVPDGEPTLDLHLGQEIKQLRKLGLKVAVITNSSLIWNKKVRAELGQAHWVSLKIDAFSPEVWRKINRPHGALSLDKILEGITQFARIFKSELATETMLVQGLNDQPREIEEIASFLASLKPKKCYIAVPIRPPAEKWVKPPDIFALNLAYQVFREKRLAAELLIGDEGNAFAFTGNAEEDLLSIMAVHPMPEDAVFEFLRKAKTDQKVVERLVKENKLVKTHYRDTVFYLRKMMDHKTAWGEAERS